jgi:hypothetical protein
MADTFDPEVEIARLEAARQIIRRLRDDLRRLKEKSERFSREPLSDANVPEENTAGGRVWYADSPSDAV